MTLISTITGVAIGGAIKNNVISQNGRSSPNPTQVIQPASPTPITQEPTQVQPIPLPENPPVAVTQEPAQVQPVNPPATLPVETPVQPEQNLRTQTGKCVNPDDLDSRGRRCGGRSAYNKGPTTGYDSNR
ncbi:hypothetical protein AB3R30_00220 [Leptolyngbyaceae cyanobacterium UHCC 1019]